MSWSSPAFVCCYRIADTGPIVEFVLSIIKIIACIGFIILGIIINCGGVGDGGYLGAKYWHHPGAFTDFSMSSLFFPQTRPSTKR